MKWEIVMYSRNVTAVKKRVTVFDVQSWHSVYLETVIRTAHNPTQSR